MYETFNKSIFRGNLKPYKATNLHPIYIKTYNILPMIRVGTRIIVRITRELIWFI